MITITDHHGNAGYELSYEFGDWNSDALLKLLDLTRRTAFTLSLYKQESGKDIVLHGAPHFEMKVFDVFESEDEGEPIFRTTRENVVALLNCFCGYVRDTRWFED